jgi:hypothetical protein
MVLFQLMQLVDAVDAAIVTEVPTAHVVNLSTK